MEDKEKKQPEKEPGNEVAEDSGGDTWGGEVFLNVNDEGEVNIYGSEDQETNFEDFDTFFSDDEEEEKGEE